MYCCCQCHIIKEHGCTIYSECFVFSRHRENLLCVLLDSRSAVKRNVSSRIDQIFYSFGAKIMMIVMIIMPL